MCEIGGRGEEGKGGGRRVRLRRERRKDRGRVVLEGEGVDWAGRINPTCENHEA